MGDQKCWSFLPHILFNSILLHLHNLTWDVSPIDILVHYSISLEFFLLLQIHTLSIASDIGVIWARISGCQGIMSFFHALIGRKMCLLHIQDMLCVLSNCTLTGYRMLKNHDCPNIARNVKILDDMYQILLLFFLHYL